MFEVIFWFCFGYLVRSLLTPVNNKYDLLLTWDKNSLGWRSVPPGFPLSPEKRYLAAVEIDLEKHQQ